jgi:Tfp pilus assembly protein PilF
MSYYDLEEKFLNADRLINEGKISEAAHKLDELLQEAPDFGKAHNHLGWLHETKFKNYSKAEEHYKYALKFSPDYTAVYYNYSYLLSTLRRFDELEKLLDQAIKIPGINFATIYNEYAIMRELQGNFREAIHYYKLYIRNNFDGKSIESASESIKRCERKMELL